MSTMETRTGYGNHHHKACDCHDCDTDRLVEDLIKGPWTGYESEDLDTPTPAPVASPGGLTGQSALPSQRRHAQNLMVLGTAIDAVFKDLDDGCDR